MVFRQKTSFYTLYIYVCVHARVDPHLTAHDIIREAGRKRVVFHAVHCNPPRSALQPSPQCSATRPAVHCIPSCSAVHPPNLFGPNSDASTCNRSCKYMRPSGITFATAKYNVCNRGCKRYKPLLQTFAGKPLWRDADEYAACTSPRYIGELATVSYAHTCMTD